MAKDQSRFDQFLTITRQYQTLVSENYTLIRTLADQISEGFEAYMGSTTGECAHLVPPGGAFKPRPYGDKALSIPSFGFRHLEPISFGLAIRVSPGTDWVRLILTCSKLGDKVTVEILGGGKYILSMPLDGNDTESFYEHIYDFVYDRFKDRIERYENGAYGSREIGFDFADMDPGDLL